MSQRTPYPFPAIEAKWRAIWSTTAREETAAVGCVGLESLQASWTECLGHRSLQTGFPGAVEAGIDRDTLAVEFGRDAVRLAHLSLPGDTPPVPPSPDQVGGTCRFLSRVWRLCVEPADEVAFEQACTMDPAQAVPALLRIGLSPAIQAHPATAPQLRIWHACLHRVEQGISQKRPHIGVAALTEFVNGAMLWPSRPLATLVEFFVLLQPFAPLLAHELASKLRSGPKLPASAETDTNELMAWRWPTSDSKFLTETALEISIQVNGKLRDKLLVSGDLSPAELEKAAVTAEKIIPHLRGKVIRKVVVIPRKLVNIAVE